MPSAASRARNSPRPQPTSSTGWCSRISVEVRALRARTRSAGPRNSSSKTAYSASPLPSRRRRRGSRPPPPPARGSSRTGCRPCRGRACSSAITDSIASAAPAARASALAHLPAQGLGREDQLTRQALQTLDPLAVALAHAGEQRLLALQRRDDLGVELALVIGERTHRPQHGAAHRAAQPLASRRSFARSARQQLRSAGGRRDLVLGVHRQGAVGLSPTMRMQRLRLFRLHCPHRSPRVELEDPDADEPSKRP